MAPTKRRGTVPLSEAQLATLVQAAPSGDEWLHEQKFDGYRIRIRVEGGQVRLWSRRGQDWTGAFPTVAKAALAIGVRNVLLDGELAVLLPSGITSFQALQNRRGDTQVTYFAFDILHLEGEDLRDLPLEQRKKRLRRLLRSRTDGVIRYSDHIVGGGPEFHAQACRLKLEGTVSKRRTSQYRGGRNLDWQKTKCVLRQEFVVGGFTDPERSREGVGALLVGYYENDRLQWAGKVGTGAGWTISFLRELRQRLNGLETSDSPFDPPVSDSWLRRNAHWVRPELVVEVAFIEWTDDGRIRHPSVQGLRPDRAPREVRREMPVRGADPQRPAESSAARRPPKTRKIRRRTG